MKHIRDSTLAFNPTDIEIVKKFKYLGVELDGRLKFDNHTEYICRQVNTRLKTLGRIRCYIGTNTALYLYGSLIAPMFSFNDFVYDGMDKQCSEKLQIAQNNCLRTCLKYDKLTPRTKLYEDSKVVPLAVQRFINTSTVVYQGLNKESTPFINNMFRHISDQHSVPTRSQIN